jgi:hypothetical protein
MSHRKTDLGIPPLQESAKVVLAVEPQQVVPGQTKATDGRVGLQATMWPMPIVAMQPVGQFGGPLVRVGTGVGPFASLFG